MCGKFKRLALFSCLFFLFSSSNFAEAKKCGCDYKHFGLIISGPSGVGKTTLINKLVKKHPSLIVSISATTRQKRKNEVNGKDYHFLDKFKFEELIKKDEFLEYAKNYDNYYGTPRRNYIEAIENGNDIVFAPSYDGMRRMKKNKKLDLITIFVLPTREEKLKERLVGRGTETEEQLNKRFESAKKEMSVANEYDYVIYNDDLKKAVKQLEAIYLAEQRKREICN